MPLSLIVLLGFCWFHFGEFLLCLLFCLLLSRRSALRMQRLIKKLSIRLALAAYVFRNLNQIFSVAFSCSVNKKKAAVFSDSVLCAELRLKRITLSHAFHSLCKSALPVENLNADCCRVDDCRVDHFLQEVYHLEDFWKTGLLSWAWGLSSRPKAIGPYGGLGWCNAQFSLPLHTGDAILNSDWLMKICTFPCARIWLFAESFWAKLKCNRQCFKIGNTSPMY